MSEKNKNSKYHLTPLTGDSMCVRILGCGSARPTLAHAPSAQIVYLRGKTFLVDCGEGTQIQMLRYRVSPANLHRIFISHLHGDHCLGLPGLLSSMSLLGMNHPVHIYGPMGLRHYVEMIVELFCPEIDERIQIHELTPTDLTEIYSDKSVIVRAFPLDHRVPTIGYRFDETPLLPHLDRAAADFYEIPIAYFGKIKLGADYTRPDGTIIANHLLTKPARAPRSYAYCSDTRYMPKIAQYVEGVDLLYHEATFEAALEQRAQETMHSTTLQAAQIAHDANAKHLLIGHYSGRYHTSQEIERLRQECLTLFDHVTAADEGLTIDLATL